MDHSGAPSNQKPAVEVAKDKNGVDQVLLRNSRGASARVSLHGGQVLSWKTEKGEELLFTSTKVISSSSSSTRQSLSSL
ncbi:hypothetical protein SDJN02_22791 [Cucurbita argyrosperma subsp. argyrosperma]|nr:hypothetical protein SDJN02_22791 [Cucurbita argyrosperma subsp. argyrosperma]